MMKVKDIRSIGSGKYKNVPIEIDGYKFPSHKEGYRYLELKGLQKKKKISDLRMQVPFVLIPTQRVKGKVVEHAVKYVADFVYHDNTTGETVVEDVKGRDRKTGKFIETREFVIKRKLMLYVHGIRIREV